MPYCRNYGCTYTVPKSGMPCANHARESIKLPAKRVSAPPATKRLEQIAARRSFWSQFPAKKIICR